MRTTNEHTPVTQRDGDAHEPCLSEFQDYLEELGYSKLRSRYFRGTARHFLVWLRSEGLDVKAVDATTLHRFRDHHCACPPPKKRGGYYRREPGRSPQFIKGVVRFVQFLEYSGRTAHPNEIGSGLGLLTNFLQQQTQRGYARRSTEKSDIAVRHFLTWLHQSRIPMVEATEGTLRRFSEHDCLCPGRFKKIATTPFAGSQIVSVRQFREYLAERGLAPTAQPTAKKIVPEELRFFRTWLQQHRGIGGSTVSEYMRTVSELRAELGNHPERYDPTQIRDVLLRLFASASRPRARRLTTGMRMYLRFLSSNGLCRPGLEGAVPGCPKWHLSELPRYIPLTDIEKVYRILRLM